MIYYCAEPSNPITHFAKCNTQVLYLQLAFSKDQTVSLSKMVFYKTRKLHIMLLQPAT